MTLRLMPSVEMYFSNNEGKQPGFSQIAEASRGSRSRALTGGRPDTPGALPPGTITTGTLECSASSRLVLPKSEPECCPDPRDPTTIKSCNPLARRSFEAGQSTGRRRPRATGPRLGSIPAPTAISSTASRCGVERPEGPGVLQEADCVHHLQASMNPCCEHGRPEESGSGVA